MTRTELIVAFMPPRGPERAADEVLRLREALRQAGGTSAEAGAIAEAALAVWPEQEQFQTKVRIQPPSR